MLSVKEGDVLVFSSGRKRKVGRLIDKGRRVSFRLDYVKGGQTTPYWESAEKNPDGTLQLPEDVIRVE